MPAAAQLSGAALALLAAAACSGCGPPPPQVAPARTSEVSAELSAIANACGETYQQHAFSPRQAPPAAVYGAALASARELAALARRHPAWIYQGEPLAAITAVSASYLSACGLPRAAAALGVDSAATAGPSNR